MSDLNLLVRSWNALDDSTTAASPIPAQLAQGESLAVSRRRARLTRCRPTGLAEKQWRLLDIVKGLGEVLVDENDAVRSRGELRSERRQGKQLILERFKGVGLLSAVVNTMDRSTLDRQSSKSSSPLPVARTRADSGSPPAQTLTTFFIGKLADGTSMLPCVSALTALTESLMFGVGEGMQVARGCGLACLSL